MCWLAATDADLGAVTLERLARLRHHLLEDPERLVPQSFVPYPAIPHRVMGVAQGALAVQELLQTLALAGMQLLAVCPRQPVLYPAEFLLGADQRVGEGEQEGVVAQRLGDPAEVPQHLRRLPPFVALSLVAQRRWALPHAPQVARAVLLIDPIRFRHVLLLEVAVTRSRRSKP